jgi:hypothetical protein
MALSPSSRLNNILEARRRTWLGKCIFRKRCAPQWGWRVQTLLCVNLILRCVFAIHTALALTNAHTAVIARALRLWRPRNFKVNAFTAFIVRLVNRTSMATIARGRDLVCCCLLQAFGVRKILLGVGRFVSLNLNAFCLGYFQWYGNLILSQWGYKGRFIKVLLENSVFVLRFLCSIFLRFMGCNLLSLWLGRVAGCGMNFWELLSVKAVTVTLLIRMKIGCLQIKSKGFKVFTEMCKFLAWFAYRASNLAT